MIRRLFASIAYDQFTSFCEKQNKNKQKNKLFSSLSKNGDVSDVIVREQKNFGIGIGIKIRKK